MKKLLFVFTILAIGSGFYFVFKDYLPTAKSSNSPFNFFIKDSGDGEVEAAISKAFWEPQYVETSKAPPVLSAKSALVAELSSNQVLFRKNPSNRQAVASLQKIITAMVTLDHLKPNDSVTISKYAASKEPDSMGLYPGEKLSVRQLLYGLILVSGNDSSVALAEAVAGTEQDFAARMNEKAKSLGLRDTFFINPSGLDEGYQYSSAFDMAAFSVYMLQNYPLLKEIAATKQITFPFTVTETENHKDFYLTNTSPTMDLEGYQGIKPGYTPEAGRCMVTLIKEGEKEYLIVVLGSEDRRGDTIALLDFVRQ